MYTNAVLVCLSAHCSTSVLSCLLQIIMLAILCISIIKFYVVLHHISLTFVHNTYCM